MRRKLLLFSLWTLICFIILLPRQAKADHFAAGDMWIVYVGPGIDGCTGTTSYDYEIYFYMYKPCDHFPPNPATLPTTTSVSYYSANGQAQGHPATGADGYSGSITLNQIETNDTLDQLCDVFKSHNTCRDFSAGAPQGYDRVRLKGTFTLPYPEPDWTFYWWSCCTSNNILNVPSYMPFYMEAMLNNVVKYNNSTPQLLIEPIPYICDNQPTRFLNGPFDVNNDSLRTYNILHYTHNSPLVAPTWLTFNAGYSLADPVISAASNPFRMDSATGTASFTPTLTGRYTFDFQTDEFDRKTGLRTGYIRRLCEINVFPCNAPPPGIDSLPLSSHVSGGSLVPRIDKSKNDVIVTCPGNNLSFSVNSESADNTRKLYMEASMGSTPGSTFVVAGAGTANVTGTYSWTPGSGDIGEHTVSITSKDSTCVGTGSLIVLKNYTVVLIKVIKGLDAGRDQKTCELNPPTRMIGVTGFGDLALHVKWTDVSGGPAIGIQDDTAYTTIVKAPGGTQYVAFSPELVDQCKSRDTVALINDTSNTIDIFPQTDKFVMCRPGYLQLDAVTKGDGPVDNVKCDTLPDYTNSARRDSISIWGSPVFGVGVPFDTIGVSAPKLASEYYSKKFQFIIPQSELREYGLRSGTIKSLSFEIAQNALGNTFLYGDFTIFLKCTNKTSLSGTTGFETGMVQVHKEAAPISLEDGVHTFQLDKPYNWDTTKSLIVGICYANNPAIAAPCTSVSTDFPGLFKYMPTTYTSTIDYLESTTADVCGVTNLTGIEELQARPVFGIGFCDVPGKPFDFTWYPGNLLSDSTIRQPLTYVPRTTTYQISTFGKNGCKVADTLQVYVPVHNFSVWPADTSICYGQTVPLEVRNGSDYQWFEYEEGQYKPSFKSLSCDYCANPVAKPLKSTHYKIMVGDEVFCYDTIDAYIEVRPLPQVHILTPDTVVKYGHSVQLLVNGAKMYNWTPVSSLNNPNISYPLATPTEPTMYVVSGISATGCYSYDTVRVGIDYRDNLNIPTAFSPNGDGKNDVFRVTNITFQKIVEFRVFNRWGQEVYNGGGDSGAGWDGNWKGVPQEIGDYNYLIRVSSPDGLVETYKGNVTLIR